MGVVSPSMKMKSISRPARRSRNPAKVRSSCESPRRKLDRLGAARELAHALGVAVAACSDVLVLGEVDAHEERVGLGNLTPRPQRSAAERPDLDHHSEPAIAQECDERGQLPRLLHCAAALRLAGEPDGARPGRDQRAEHAGCLAEHGRRILNARVGSRRSIRPARGGASSRRRACRCARRRRPPSRSGGRCRRCRPTSTPSARSRASPRT